MKERNYEHLYYPDNWCYTRVELMGDLEKELLTNIAYLAEGMFDCEVHRNFGDAKEWKHKLRIATDKYYDFLYLDDEDD